MKPQYLKDNQIKLELKEDVINRVNKIEEIKKKGIPEKKILKWPVDKKITDQKCRIRFLNNSRGRQRAIYFKEYDYGKIVKNHVIFQRLMSKRSSS